MMPRLYDAVADKSAYSNNGYGFFTTCSKCEVTEERNGAYSLAMTISNNDPLADVAVVGMFVKAKANQYDSPQLFEINEIIISSEGTVEINANHIKFLGLQNTVNNEYNFSGEPWRATPEEIVNDLLKDTIIENNLFTFTSNIAEHKDYDLSAAASMKLGDILGGTEGSILDIFGGEFHYDNFKIELLESRGTDTGKKIMFGKNMSDYVQTMTNDDAYTHYIGYAKVGVVGDTNKTVILAGNPTQTSRSFVFPKVKLFDFTSRLPEFVDSGTIKVDPATGENYSLVKDLLLFCSNEQLILNERPAASVNITITYAAELDKLQDIRLCDTVTVCFGRGKGSTKSKITKVVYDSILERYILVEVGEKAVSLYDYLTKLRR